MGTVLFDHRKSTGDGCLLCRYGEITLAPQATAPAQVRTWLRERFAEWELPDSLDDLQVVVSELVTNAVLHARSTVGVEVSAGEGLIEVAVADFDDRPPEVRQPDEERDEGGRGLVLVSALSDEWGVSHRARGKQIWVRVPVPKNWRYSEACVCARSPDDPTRATASGRRVVHMLP